MARFIEERRGALVDLAFSVLRCQDDAQDAVQHLVLGWLERGTDPGRLPDAYVGRSVMNACRDLLRRRSARVRAAAEWRRHLVIELSLCSDEADGSSANQVLRMMIDALPPRQQEILTKVHLEGRSPSEVADELGIAQRTVVQLCWRARSRLSQLGDIGEARE